MNFVSYDATDPDNYPQEVDFWLMEIDELSVHEKAGTMTTQERIRRSILMQKVDDYWKAEGFY